MENIDIDEDQYIPEDLHNRKLFHNQIHSKPKTTLDYLAYHSNEYHIYKLREKIKLKIQAFNFDNKITEEIISLCVTYHPHLKLSILIPIVIYKIIQKYNFPFTNGDLLNKIALNKSHYLKYGSLIKLHTEINRSYQDDVYDYIEYVISKINDIAKNKPMIFRKYNKKAMKDEEIKRELEDLANKFLSFSDKEMISKGFEDIEEKFTKIKGKCKEFVYGSQSSFNYEEDNKKKEDEDILYTVDNDFNKFFEGKINKKHLAVAIVKMMMKEYQLNINQRELKNAFLIPTSSLTKGNALLKEYSRRNGLLFYSDD